MTRDDIGDENSAVHANGRLARDEDEIRAAIGRELAWHADLFDDSWDEVMQATPREIDALLSDAGRPVTAAGVGRMAQLARHWCDQSAVAAGRSTAAAAKLFGRTVQEFIALLARSGQGSARKPLLLTLASFAVVAIVLQFMLLDQGKGGGTPASEIESDQGVSGVAWRQDSAGRYHDPLVRTAAIDGNRPSPRQAAPVAGVSTPRPVAHVDRPALLVAPLPAQALPLAAAASLQMAVAASAEPQSVAAPDSGLAIVPLSVDCSEAVDKVDCTLKKPSTASRRVVLSDVLSARMRDEYSASAKLGGGMVCVVGPQQGSAIDCREVPRPAEWHSAFGGVPFETMSVSLESGAVRVKAKRTGERPINP
jgi:hypothetical protein